MSKPTIPNWMLVPGTYFRDPEKDICVVLGVGGYRDVEPTAEVRLYGQGHNKVLYELLFKPRGLIYACLYKGEWHLWDLSNKDTKWFDGCLEMTRPEIEELGGKLFNQAFLSGMSEAGFSKPTT